MCQLRNNRALLRKKAAKISAPPSAAPQRVSAERKTPAESAAKAAGNAVKSHTLKISKV